MTDQAPKAAAGWYPTPEGGQRYWDGDQWTSLPEPPSSASSSEHSKKPARSRRPTVLAGVVMAGVLLVAGGVAFAVKAGVDQRAAAELAEAEAQAAEEKAAEEKREAEDAARTARVERAIAREERAKRDDLVLQVETAIADMARGHIAEGFIDGPVESVGCNPVAGGSTDDLSAQTAVLECFAAGPRDSSGNARGWFYNATVNWDTRSYTYGWGKP